MTKISYCGDDTPKATFKTELLALWIEQEWIANHPDTAWTIVGMNSTPLELTVISQFSIEHVLAEGYRFIGRKRAPESMIPYIYQQLRQGQLDDSTGTYLYQFQRGDEVVDVLVASAYYHDEWYQTSIACVPDAFLEVWASFKIQCDKFAYPEDEIMIIGGHRRSFETNMRLPDIILSDVLKQDILQDVASFYDRGVAIYQRMGLNPFRKLLFAGVPGTGKTMMCNALANWALDRGYRVIYVSSSQRGMGEEDGANFWKIQHALYTASNSGKPALIILEEIDAYLKEAEKALILNVLDGSEADENPHGTLLISTTNYPEAIDERVLKRPGRLDRVYMIPPIEDAYQASAMLRHYLKDLWQEDHRQFAPELVGYPGAFVREVAVYAITQLIETDAMTLSLAQLQDSYGKLRQQIEDRDQFIKARENGHES